VSDAEAIALKMSVNQWVSSGYSSGPMAWRHALTITTTCAAVGELHDRIG
jgi:hypothetical protein